MRLNPRFYSHPSRELLRLKKGLIKIWGDLAKKHRTKQGTKQEQKQNKTFMHTKDVSISGDLAREARLRSTMGK